MKFIMLMIPTVYRGNKKLDGFKPKIEEMEPMGRFSDEMGKTLKIESIAGLKPLSEGARVSFSNGKPTVTDGGAVQAGDVLGGFWILEAPSKEAVIKWAQRCPAADGDVLEIRQIWDLAELEAQETGKH